MNHNRMLLKMAMPLVAALFLVLAMPAFSSEKTNGGIAQVTTTSEDQSNVAITIYNDGTGLVKDTRKISLPEGLFDLVYMDVAAAIDPTSVHFVSLSRPDALGILEQNYEYDLVDTAALYAANIDHHVSLRMSDGRTIEGTLLAFDGNLVVKTSDGIEIIGAANEVKFDELREGLMTRPALKWSLENNSAGVQDTEMSYLTTGLGWSANYVAVVGQNDDVLDLSGWVTIDNQSGGSYRDALLKLVAGEVHRVVPGVPDYALTMGAEGGAGEEKAFQEESFFEYHLYTLQRPATVLNNQQKQISLLNGENIKATKVLIYDPGFTYYSAGDTSNGEIETRLKFTNSEANNLGMPIPAGVLRVYKKDSSGSLQFIGEDNVDHTPKDEEIDVNLGKAFDIVGEMVVLDRRKISSTKWEYDVQMTLRNHKDEDVTIIYRDHAWGDWKVMKSSLDFKQTDASTMEFNVPVKSNGETVLTYTVRRDS